MSLINKNKFKNILIYCIIFFITIICFDTVAYLSGVKAKYFPLLINRRAYPEGYFVGDPVLGHDIKRNHAGVVFNWGDAEAQVFSNKYGCFDKNEQYKKPLIYLAGDSVTWGYDSYEHKFGTLLEEKLGVNIAKCGVTHTGQYHQLKKLQKWSSETNIDPDVVVVTWVSNDEGNDFMFPQTIVIKNKFVDRVTIVVENGKPVRKVVPEIQNKIEKYEVGLADNQHSLMRDVTHILKKYSITANIIRSALTQYIGNSFRDLFASGTSESAETFIRKSNFNAIDEFIRHAEEKEIKLLFVVYSAKTSHIFEFLEKKKQHYLDYNKQIESMGIDGRDVRWPIDGHPNTEGNRVLSDIIARYVKKHFLDLAGLEK